MRVIINGVTTVKAKTGVGHYTASLFDALRGRADCTLYPFGVARRAAELGYRTVAAGKTEQTVGKSRRRSTVGLKTFGRDIGYRLCQEHFRSACRDGFSLYHEPNFIPWPGDLPTVCTVHDLSVLLFPQWHPASRVKMHEERFHAGLRRCDHFIAVSEFTRSEMIDRLGVNPDRVTAVPNGVRSGLGPLPESAVRDGLARLNLTPGYLLYVGTLEPRKNLGTLLRAYCDLPDAVRRQCPLVLVGGWGWGAADLREYFHTTARHRGVSHLGYLADAALPTLYNGASALVYPSHYEGFGLPLLEMMACGGAVIASSAGAHREILGPDADLIDPGDMAGWRDALSRAATDGEFLTGLRSGVRERAATFTWAAAAERTLAVYRLVAGSDAGGSGPRSGSAAPGSTSAGAPRGPEPNRAARGAA